MIPLLASLEADIVANEAGPQSGLDGKEEAFDLSAGKLPNGFEPGFHVGLRLGYRCSGKRVGALKSGTGIQE
jgi:hypothetical protein